MGEKKKKEKKEKPLERWTVKELREEALSIPNIMGVHGMNKEELLAEIREAKGIPKPEKKKTGSVREVKTKMVEVRKQRDTERAEGAPRTKLNILRKKLSKLKKQTRV